MHVSILTIFAVILLSVGINASKHCKCYLIEQAGYSGYTWSDASDYCKRKGGDLVKIDDSVEDNHILNLLQTESRSNRQSGWWIGGKSINGQWQWSDGSDMTYMNFPPQGEVAFDSVAGMVINYAGIFYGYGSYKWDYLSSRASNKMGLICEIDSC